MWCYSIFLLLFLVGSRCSGDSIDCLVKEKSLGVLDFAKGTIEKVKDLLSNCTNDPPPENASECGVKDKALALLDITKDLISEAEKNCSACSDLVPKPIDCKDIMQQGNNISGVYRVWPLNDYLNRTSILVYCDMDTDGGGWTVIQRRGRNYTMQNFYQDWDTYKRGFGDLNGEFWLGNDKIYALVKQVRYALRIDLESFTGYRRYALYDSFQIENEKALYKLHVAGYSGTAGDSMKFEDGHVFCTKDRPNGKQFNKVPCVVSRETGWWFYMCNRANLNEVPVAGYPEDRRNLYWIMWKQYESLAYADMKLRRT